MTELPLLLLSGLACDDRVWREVVPALAPRADIRFLHFDGFSAIPAMAAHVLATAPPRFVVAGHSMGGRVALAMAGMAPERLGGMALLSTGIRPAGPAEPERGVRLMAIARRQGMAALAADWLPPLLCDGPARNPALFTDLAAMVAARHPDSFCGQVEALLHRPDMTASLAAFPGPVLLLCGAADQWSPPADHLDMAARAVHSVGARVQIIAGAGHFLPVEQPVAVAAALNAWLETL